MFFDAYHYIQMEQNPPSDPGRLGDSMAETGRYITIAYVIGDDPQINLFTFMTDKGFVRHPESIWREDDMSSDQLAPFLAAASLSQPLLAGITINRLKDASNKTGNGDIISIGLRNRIARHQGSKFQSLYDLAFIGDALLFKVPFRWSDSEKKFERSEGSSADYLNFANGLFYAHAKNKKLSLPLKIALKLVGKEKILQKVKDYYKPEPNSQVIIDMYTKALGII